jgi:hypothetical protein
LLAAEASRRPQLANENLDVGKPTQYGTYEGSDKTYPRLVDKLAKKHFDGIPSELRNNILAFYGDCRKLDPGLRQPIATLKNPF